MTLGQSLLATASLIAITILVINAYRIVIVSKEDELRGEAIKIAGDLATALINEALEKKYDENATKSYFQETSEFSTYLRPTSTEASIVRLPDTTYRSITGYNDFDDYNGYIRAINTSTLTGFSLRCVVNYVPSATPNVPTTSKTYTKRMEVYVKNPLYMKNDSLVFYATLSY